MRSEVAKARRTQLAFARSIEADLVGGVSVDDMVSAATRDRCALSRELCGAADVLIRSSQRSGNVAAARSAVSRGYYSMFQAARAVVFVSHRGDDKNDHQELPKALPSDFPNRAQWQNELKEARVLRNDADYDPYPSNAGHWLAEAKAVRRKAEDFLDESENYLRLKGAI